MKGNAVARRLGALLTLAAILAITWWLMVGSKLPYHWEGREMVTSITMPADCQKVVNVSQEFGNRWVFTYYDNSRQLHSASYHVVAGSQVRWLQPPEQ